MASPTDVGRAALAELLVDADRGLERQVDCAGCQACCHNEVVLLDEDPAEYEVEHKPGDETLWFLKHRADGGCIYLGDQGCTIRERRPAICRAFDCGLWFLTTNRAYRRAAAKKGDEHDRQMLLSGRRVATARGWL